MERVFYCAGSSFLTGSDIAQAVIDYARWVALRGDVEIVAVPTLTADGALGRTAMLLTATTQLACETIVLGDLELIDDEFVGRLRAEVQRMSSPIHAVAAEEAPSRLDPAYDF